MTIKEAIRQLKTYKPEMECAVALWQPDDATGRAKNRGITLTKDEADEVIYLVQRTQDCELGISWITIDCAIDEIINRR